MDRRIAVIAEDRLTEAVILKCISVFLPSFSVHTRDVKGGRGNVQRSLNAYLSLATVMPVVIGVDLDQDECAPTLLRSWKIPDPIPPKFLLRVAVREVESWVLGDRKQFAKFVGGQSDDIPVDPDGLEDPKKFLLEYARKTARSDLKRALIPVNFAQYPRIGPAYNLHMCGFARDKWRPQVASSRSGSLARLVSALQALDAS
jgi:hypothetical protein